MTKRFKAVRVEDEYEKNNFGWEVVDRKDYFCCAEFWGYYSQTYARDHARRLNGLKEKEKP